MGRSRKTFLPSITQVLENSWHQHAYHEGPSSVIIWVDFIQPGSGGKLSQIKRPQTPLSHLMKSIDLQGAEPAQEGVEHFSYIVCFPDDAPDNSQLEPETPFAGYCSAVSRGYHSASDKDASSHFGDFLRDKLFTIAKNVQKLVPAGMPEPLLRRLGSV